MIEIHRRFGVKY